MINEQLLDEYGLNQVNFTLLALVGATGPVQWPDPDLKRISGQPAPSLRKLVKRGLLDGPARGEAIRSKPFAITDKGQDILARIDRGLHRTTWLSAGRVKVLEMLADRDVARRGHLLNNGAHHMSLISLRDAEYILASADGQWLTITALGLEALHEYRQERQPEGVAA